MIMFKAKIWSHEEADPDTVYVSDLKRAGQIMDAFLAVGWWRIDWYKMGVPERLVATVRFNENDELDPVIMEVLSANAA